VAKQKATPEMWAEARREWETSASASYGTIAAKYLISKALVGQESKRAGWVKRIGLNANAPKGDRSTGIETLQKSQKQAARSHDLDGLGAKNMGYVGAASTAPATEQSADGGGMPEGLTREQEQEWIERAIRARQTALNQAQSKELKAAKATIYAAIKGASGPDGYNAARTAKQIVSALAQQHARELEHEALRVRLELGDYHGAQGPRPASIHLPPRASIHVHMVPSVRIGGTSPEPRAGSRAVPAREMAEAVRVDRGGDVQDVDFKGVRP